jgi:hypothetical protein
MGVHTYVRAHCTGNDFDLPSEIQNRHAWRTTPPCTMAKIISPNFYVSRNEGLITINPDLAARARDGPWATTGVMTAVSLFILAKSTR